jgi:hypothetical protein
MGNRFEDKTQGSEERFPPGSPRPPLAEDDDGVDVSLIRWMLSLTPRERLEALQAHVRATLELRGRLS